MSETFSLLLLLIFYFSENKTKRKNKKKMLSGRRLIADELFQSIVRFAFVAEAAHDATTATHDFAGFAVFVQFAKTDPFTEFLIVIDT